MNSTAGNRSPEQLCTVQYVSSVDISTKNRQKAVPLIIIPLMILPIKKSVVHLYTYTTETAEDGVRIHKGTCSVCGHTMDGACVFDPDGICEICGQPCTHEYTVGQSLDESYHQLVCKFCGHTEKEEHQIGESADSQKYCAACGYSLNE